MRILLLVICFFWVMVSCRERYGLPMEDARDNALVVEGNILNGDTTVIHLSRTSPVAERSLIAEEGANVQVEGDDNSIFPLRETGPGVYKSDHLTLNVNHKYRLKILSGGAEYESEWLAVMNTPDIDSVTWKRENGVEIFVASHGTSTDTRYYKWDYSEVWDFYSRFRSKAFFTYVLDANGQKVYQCVDKTLDGVTATVCIDSYDPAGNTWSDSMYHCWKYNNSTNINIGSTAALSDNVVFIPLRKFDEDTWELSSLYSILVKQTGLSKESYEFYNILKENSEGVGSIFDAQPSQMKTNMRCVSNPGEIVIGFIDATTVRSKRIFINNRELPGWRYEPFNCSDTLTNALVPLADAIATNMIPVEVLQFERQPPYRVVSYSLSQAQCVDCQIRGIHRKPEFWPQ